MSQKSSFPHPTDSVQYVLTSNKDVMKEFKGVPALDAGLLATARAVEHYEIARYGTLKTWASELGLKKPLGCWKARSLKKRRPMRP